MYQHVLIKMDDIMKIVELSFQVDASDTKYSGSSGRHVFSFSRKEVPLKSENIRYTGIIYDIGGNVYRFARTYQ